MIFYLAKCFFIIHVHEIDHLAKDINLLIANCIKEKKAAMDVQAARLMSFLSFRFQFQDSDSGVISLLTDIANVY